MIVTKRQAWSSPSSINNQSWANSLPISILVGYRTMVNQTWPRCKWSSSSVWMIPMNLHPHFSHRIQYKKIDKRHVQSQASVIDPLPFSLILTDININQKKIKRKTSPDYIARIFLSALWVSKPRNNSSEICVKDEHSHSSVETWSVPPS